jgi:hypothetical protein
MMIHDAPMIIHDVTGMIIFTTGMIVDVMSGAIPGTHVYCQL